MSLLLRLARSKSGNAAVEMVLVLPILLVLVFGSVEVGNYFFSEHVVQTGVRDAARYAARLPYSSLAGSGCAIGGTTMQDSVKRVARTGDPTDGASDPRLWFWTDNATVTMTLACTTGTYAGIYTDFPAGAPVVRVEAELTYQPFFRFMPFVRDDSDIKLYASSEAAAAGV